ncbi:Hypothetical_protein [Hexamita inflata]|uniref:Hypothetical_protein n=1 Tax=Hexamita inflata TaxID=28002 RepID=A0AA86TQ53_9EUKA|nr:Hypothetical protein HINF_LOCUS6858 [Hexamita inflata]
MQLHSYIGSLQSTSITDLNINKEVSQAKRPEQHGVQPKDQHKNQSKKKTGVVKSQKGSTQDHEIARQLFQITMTFNDDSFIYIFSSYYKQSELIPHSRSNIMIRNIFKLQVQYFSFSVNPQTQRFFEKQKYRGKLIV